MERDSLKQPNGNRDSVDVDLENWDEVPEDVKQEIHDLANKMAEAFGIDIDELKKENEDEPPDA